MKTKRFYGHNVTYNTRRYGQRVVYYWIDTIDNNEIGGDPFPNRESFLNYVKSYNK